MAWREKSGDKGAGLAEYLPPMAKTTALLTNDDGIDAEGLAALEAAMAEIFDEIWVVAPAEQASQIGHRVVTDVPIRFEKRGERRYAVSSTPADCVRVALAHLLPAQPDWVLSGINHGGNLGRHDIHISGTVAAAREGAFLGVPGAAFSHYTRERAAPCWESASRRAGEVFRSLRDEAIRPGQFWNVNLPHPEPGDPEPGTVRCEAETSPLEVGYTVSAPGELAYTGRYHARPRSPDRDVAVCFGGNIAVSLLSV